MSLPLFYTLTCGDTEEMKISASYYRVPLFKYPLFKYVVHTLGLCHFCHFASVAAHVSRQCVSLESATGDSVISLLTSHVASLHLSGFRSLSNHLDNQQSEKWVLSLSPSSFETFDPFLNQTQC